MAIQTVTINVEAQPTADRIQTFLVLSQNENGRQIRFRILGDELPAGCTATLSGEKPDGNVWSKAGTVSDNFVTVDEDIQMTAVAGRWDAQLDIVHGLENIVTAPIRITVEPAAVDAGAVPSDTQLEGYVEQCKQYAESAKNEAYGSPLTAATAADMTDQGRVYVYTGSETGYTSGHWYYYDGSAWTDGGVYNAVAVDTDTTLAISGKAADAKKTGDEISQIKEDFTDIQTSIKSELGHRYGDGETTTETRSAYYITGTYGVVKPLGSGNANYKVERYSVTGGDVYRISGSVYGDTSVYSFYDSNDTPIKWYNDHGGSGFHAVTNVIDIAPSNAVYLYVAHIISKGDALVEKRLNGWTGIKWAMMGDSITDSNNQRATKRYFDYIAEMTGITTVNLGKSGTGYKKDYNSNLPFYQRVDTIPTDSDVITIFGSGNDCSQTLGTPTDSTADTVCGCINLTIDGIRDRIVGANLGIITPTPWVQYPTTTADNAMDLYCDALVEICRLKGVPCLDLYHCSNMLPWEEDFRTAFYKHDDGNGVHPDEDGHKLFAPRIKAFLDTLLM